jgi:hypothetical protein
MTIQGEYGPNPGANDRCQRGLVPVILEDGAVQIPLTRGQVAIVDAADYPVVAGRRWFARWNKKTGSFYAESNSGNRTRGVSAYIHREVACPGPGLWVDHINHDTLDNRRSNLRIVTNSQNQANQRPQVGKSSRFKGVSWRARTGRWEAYIKVSGKKLPLGYHRDEVSAALAYDKAATEAFGQYALTNLG